MASSPSRAMMVNVVNAMVAGEREILSSATQASRFLSVAS